MAKKLTEEELAKLTPEQRNAVLEERKRRAEERKRKEKEDDKAFLKGLLIFALVFLVIPMAIWGAIELWSNVKPTQEEKIAKYVENYQFAEARQVLAKMETKDEDETKQKDNERKKRDLSDKITQAEITYFLDEGDYLKAYDSAKEGGKIKYYQSMVISRIPQVYEQKGASALIKFLGSIVFPEQGALPYTTEFINSQKDPQLRALMKQTNENWNSGYKEFVNSYNTALSNLIKAIEVDGKKEEAAALKSMLK